ncbi:MAG: FecCD family ABC transporter permease [Crocinitomicaceae bacterium]
MIDKKNIVLFFAVLLMLVVFSFVSLKIGSVSISFADLWAVLSGDEIANPTYEYIIFSRINRTIVSLLAGGALALSGLILQVFFRNPLAGPGVLGISSGAALGVAAVVLGGFTLQQFSGYTLTLFAGLIGAVSVLGLLLIISRYVHQMVTLLVVGLMLSYFSSAVLNVLYQWANSEATREFVVWGLGSFEGLSSSRLTVFTVVILFTLLLSFVLVKPLNALALGEDYAKSMGVNVSKTRWKIIIITGVLTSVVTVFCGPIGFLGMAVPQLSRQLAKNQNQAFIMPFTIVLGAFFALSADIFVRLFDAGIPLNTATSLIGAPIIIWAIFKLNSRRI